MVNAPTTNNDVLCLLQNGNLGADGGGNRLSLYIEWLWLKFSMACGRGIAKCLDDEKYLFCFLHRHNDKRKHIKSLKRAE